MSARNCVTHHWACDCREAKFKRMENLLRDLLGMMVEWDQKTLADEIREVLK